MSDIKLPVDATGKEIPLDTTVLYSKDGEQVIVEEWTYNKTFLNKWMFSVTGFMQRRVPHHFYLDKPESPDSWEKLLEDLAGIAEQKTSLCNYFQEGSEPCAQKPGCYEAECLRAVIADIADRIRKLRGEGDD